MNKFKAGSLCWCKTVQIRYFAFFTWEEINAKANIQLVITKSSIHPSRGLAKYLKIIRFSILPMREWLAALLKNI